MKTSFVLFALLASVPANAVETNPIEKVLQMMSELSAKIIKEGEGAQGVYEEFAEWCEDKSKELGFEIKTGKATSAELQATIQKESSRIDELNTKVEELTSSIAEDEADLKAATGIRETEAADFAKEEAELTQVIDMLHRAVTIIEREMAKGGASMMQLQNTASVTQALSIMVKASVFDAADAQRLTSLVQSSQSEDSESDETGAGAPDAAVYESHSGSIVETLEGLEEKAEAELADARGKETTSKNNYEMLKQGLLDEIKFANKDMAEAKKNLAQSSESKANAEGDLSVTSKDLAEDVSSLADLHHQCMTKAAEFEAATTSRGEELKAIAFAKKAIADSTGGAADQTYGLNQVSFVQLSTGMDLANFEAVRFVRKLAQKEGSAALSQLASRMASAMRFSQASGADPFAKVKGLISDMIAKLEGEAEEDATKKAFCDKELSETTAKKEDKEAIIAKLTAKIDKASARSTKLKGEVATLQKELSEQANSQAEMDKIRGEEKGQYDADHPEMQAGLEGVKLALKILRDYYAKADKAHSSADGAGSGIIGLLEVCEADFSKGITEMEAAEKSAAAEHEATTKDNDMTRTAKDQDVKYKTKEFKSLDKTITELTSDKEGVTTELSAILEQLDKLNDQCVAVPETYAERKARREAEIAGLKEALQILENEAALIQKSSRRTLRGTKRHVAA